MVNSRTRSQTETLKSCKKHFEVGFSVIFELVDVNKFYRMIFFTIFSLYGLASAYTFKSITNEELDEVQDFVRNELHDLLEAKATALGRALTYEEKEAFFGLFASSPKKFSFLGERKMIVQMANYVKQKVEVKGTDEIEDNNQLQTEQLDTNNGGLAYFLPDSYNPSKKRKIMESGIVRTPLGTIFGDRNIQNAARTEHTLEAVKKSLFGGAKQIFDMIGQNELSLEMIEVDFVDAKNITGNVTCVFCQTKSRVYFGASGSWVLSNLKTHINSCTNTEKKKKPLKVVPKKTLDRKVDKQPQIRTASTPTAPTQTAPNQTASTPTHVMRSDLEGELFTQMSVQNIKVINASISHEEHREKCTVDVCEGGQSIDVCNIAGDGDCLFGSIAHQLFCVKLGSDDHVRYTHQLRKESVDYITSNFATFEHEIGGRLLKYRGDKKKIRSGDSSKFLDRLAESGFFGGEESLKAIALKYSINIVVFNEKGTCYISNRFNKDHNRTIFLVFRGEGSNDERNHYDSVVEIDKGLIEVSVELLIDREMQYIINKDKSDVVSIDDSIDG